MTVDPFRLLRAALLIGLALVIAKLFVAGEMVKYMTPALDPLTGLTGLLLAAMGVMELRGRDHAGERGHAHGGDGLEQALTSLLVALPIALGLFVTPRALGSSALGGEDVAGLLLTFAPRTAAPPASAPPAPAGPLEDVADLLAYLGQAGESGIGRRVRATGLVARSQTLEANQFALLRYSIAHCVADARPLALLVVPTGDPAVPADQWVEVEGVLAASAREGDRLVSIVADRVVPVEEPRNPYLRAAF